MLFHISQESSIDRFDPRASEYASGLVVWAIDADRLRNYLLPRECPRVTYYAGPETTPADVEKRPLSQSKAAGSRVCGQVGCTAITYRRRPSSVLMNAPA